MKMKHILNFSFSLCFLLMLTLAQAQEKPQQSQPQQTVSVDKVRKEIPNFKVSDKSDIGKVSVKQRREVSMKIDDLAKKSAEAKANGEKAPNFNLCDITIPGTNLYCGGNKGIPREQMPQFKGKPQPGSIADGLPKDKDGEVDTEAMFKKMLEDKGIKVSEPTQVPADQLKATQTELVGPKVAGMSKALDTDPNHPGITAPIYVSSDGYVLDGHHRFWAYKLVGVKSIPAQLVPAEDVEEVGRPDVAENFADGKNPGRKGLAKRSGVNTKASVSSLRKTAKNSSGEKQRMAHWLANMKAGRAKAKRK